MIKKSLGLSALRAVIAAMGLTAVAAAQDPPPVPPALVPNKTALETVIRLDTNEWLRGRVEYMNYGRLYFNSRKLDRLNIDWDDAHLFTTTETLQYVFRDDTKLRGVGRADRKQLTLRLPDGTERKFPRETLLAIYPGERAIGKLRWFGKITGSYETTSGNTDENDFDFYADLTGRAGSLEIRTQANSAFSKNSGDVTRKQHSFATQATFDLSRLFYVIPAQVSAEYDRLKNISRRYRLAIGAGINIFRTNNLNWRVEAGPGYEFTRFRDVQPGQDRTDDRFAVYLGSTFDWEITGDIDAKSDMRGYTGSGVTTMNWRSTLSFDITKNFDLDLTLVWDWNGQPERDSNGRLPDRSDVRFLVGLGWEF